MTIKFRLIMPLFALLAGGSACKKVKYQQDVHDYYPKVATTSVTIQPDGSAKITGDVLSSGTGELYFVGFCMDTAPHPQMHYNQKLVNELNGTSFTATYANLNAIKRYYVRSFAANEHGYAYGEDLVIDHAGLDTTTIPCHPGDNTIMTETSSSTKMDNLRSSNIDVPDPVTHKFSVTSSNLSLSLRFEFGKTPISGQYKIWDHVSIGSGNVSILFNDPNLGSYYMENGGTIYVQQVDANRIKVWMCHQAVYSGKFVTTTFTTR